MEKAKMELIKTKNEMVLDGLKNLEDMLDGNKNLINNNKLKIGKDVWDWYDDLSLAETALHRAVSDVHEARAWLMRFNKRLEEELTNNEQSSYNDVKG